MPTPFHSSVIRNSNPVVLEHEDFRKTGLSANESLFSMPSDSAQPWSQECIRSDFLALESHMANCAQKKGFLSDLKEIANHGVDFAKARLVSLACVLGLVGFGIVKTVNYFAA